MDIILSICVGIGLSAACGFRVFIPPLIMSIASLSGHLTLSQNFAWMGTYPALIAFAVAASLEVGAYYVPWLDHLLDSIASPAAIIAGTIVTASLITDMSPFLKWTLALIAGGGAAAAIQSLTVLTRGASLVGTGGLANPLVATAELGGSILTSALALVIPVFTVLVILALLLVAGSKILAKRAEQQVQISP
jgi:Domain of unknown function (DUF4126)